ncbi:HAD-IIIC family phosphatase [Sphaerisporangium flaviroseum]|uniref:HAD-IIIC family phosphatase n=1 Tax=Sphaerisporangium flaviroseum TaxID=509199 RepID=A0ABP7IE51_9ACTN
MSPDEVLERLTLLTRPDAAPDPAVLAALDGLDTPDGTSVLVEAGRLLADVPAHLVCDADRPPRPLRVAVAATFTAESVAPLLRLFLLRAGIAAELHVCPFDQAEVQLADPGSGLAAFRPDVTLLLLHDEALLPDDWDPAEPASLREPLHRRLATLERAIGGFTGRSPGTVLSHTVPLSRAEQRSVISYRDRAALGRVWRELNGAMLEMPERHASVHVLDFESLLTGHPGALRDDRLHRFAGMAWSPGVEALYAREAAAFCRAVAGLSRKVLVLDLDDTLWGGIVGDDGPGGIQLGPLYPGNAYVELQRRVRSLRRQGVLLAVASKNDADLVDQVLAGHPGMLLRAEDFVMRMVDWRPKDGNLRLAAESLGLGLDSFVFADDSRFECDLVRHALPEVAVVRLSGDPATHAARLLEHDHFAVLATTAGDRDRTGLYRARADRRRSAESFTSAEDYLHSLGLRVTLRRADDYSVPRLTQLGLRANQFTTVKGAHSEAGTRAFACSPDHLLLGFEVADDFAAEGIVGGVWIARRPGRWLIENFVMSCRVLARGVEYAALQGVIDRALAEGVSTIEADFRPSGRNHQAGEFYHAAGFRRAGDDRLALPLTPRPRLLPAWVELINEEDTVHA